MLHNTIKRKYQVINYIFTVLLSVGLLISIPELSNPPTLLYAMAAGVLLSYLLILQIKATSNFIVPYLFAISIILFGVGLFYDAISVIFGSNFVFLLELDSKYKIATVFNNFFCFFAGAWYVFFGILLCIMTFKDKFSTKRIRLLGVVAFLLVLLSECSVIVFLGSFNVNIDTILLFSIFTYACFMPMDINEEDGRALSTEYISCANCNHPVVSTARFCSMCGSKIEKEDTSKCAGCHNTVPQGSLFCPYCGRKKAENKEAHPISVNASPNASTPSNKENIETTIPPYFTTQRPLKQAKKWAPEKIGLIVLAVIMGISLFFVILHSCGIDNLTQDADNSLTPVAEPKSGAILYGIEGGPAELKVSAAWGEACVVKLKDIQGNTVLSFYVRAGTTRTVKVPSQYLFVYFASGKTWYGKEHLFGEDTSYFMDDEFCDFKINSYEYTLYPVYDGNFNQTQIDKEDFY